MRILVAEDDSTMRQLMATLLSRKGITCTVVENGLNAVELSAQDDYDFILMDVQMPIMDGYEATRLIREREAAGGRRTTIIALTAYAMAVDRQKCLDSGMDDYISKPIDFDELLSLFKKHSRSL